ncbi:MAG: helix-turn-helix domain-containing protein, partial [Pseudomonadota bacterium]
LVRIDPVFRERVMRLMASEIDNLRTHFTMLNKKHAIGRLAAFLCFFTERYGEEQSDGIRLSLPMAREDIADFLHLTAETVSRHFTYLKKEGTIVCMGPRALNIVRLARLRQLAE